MRPDRKICAAAKEWLSWSSLIKFSISPIRQFSYFGTILVPLYAQILSAANTFRAGGAHLAFPFPNTLPSDLVLAYLTVSTFSIATFLSELFCPRKIREYKSLPGYFGFIVAQSKNIESVKLLDSLAVTRDSSLSLRSTLESSPLDDEDIEKLEHYLGIGSKLDQFQLQLLGNFDGVWEDDNKRHPLVRAVVGTLYAFSISIAFIQLAYLTPKDVFGVTSLDKLFSEFV